MKKTIKLKKNYEFNFVFKNGKYCKGDFLECFYTKKNKKNYNLLGIAISSKLCNAVRRNKIKRIITAVYTKIENSIELGNTFVFLWRKNIEVERCTFKNVYKDMVEMFKKLGILNEKDFNIDN